MLLLSLISSAIIIDAIFMDCEKTRRIVKFFKNKLAGKPQVTINTAIIIENTPQEEMGNNQPKKDGDIEIDLTNGQINSVKYLFAVLFTYNFEAEQNFNGSGTDYTLILEKNVAEPDKFKEYIEENFLGKNFLIDGNNVDVYKIVCGSVLFHKPETTEMPFDNVVIRSNDEPWTPRDHKTYKENMENVPPLIDLTQDPLPQFKKEKQRIWVYNSLIGCYRDKIIENVLTNTKKNV